MLKESQILSSEAVIAYLHRNLADGYIPDDLDTNMRTTKIRWIGMERTAILTADGTTQELQGPIKSAFGNWAKFYVSNLSHHPHNCGRIQGSGLRPEYLPLTPEVHAYVLAMEMCIN
jgi:hypothetical protein